MTTITRRELAALLAGTVLSARASAAPALRRSGIQEVVVSVFDIDQFARGFVEAGEFRRFALPDAAPEQFAAWRVPAGCTRIEQAHLVHPSSPESRGGLRLVKFHGVEQKVMRSSQRSWDTGGIFDVDVYARDVDSSYRALQRHGWTAFGEPVEYREAEFHVRQVVAVGPDGLVLAIIQRFSPPVPALDADPALRMTAVFNSTQMVRDFEEFGVRAFTAFNCGYNPQVGIDEDPVTGSAHCALAPFWAAKLGRTTLTAFQWTNAQLTFDQALPAGRYQIVGGRMESAGLLAWRCVIVGGLWRPGAIGFAARR